MDLNALVDANTDYNTVQTYIQTAQQKVAEHLPPQQSVDSFLNAVFGFYNLASKLVFDALFLLFVNPLIFGAMLFGLPLLFSILVGLFKPIGKISILIRYALFFVFLLITAPWWSPFIAGFLR